MLIDENSEFGARVARHLREEIVVWLTSVSAERAPVPRPVWFIWDEPASLRVHSLDGMRTRNLSRNQKVSLNFGGDGRGGDVVVLSGEARIASELPSADRDPSYISKYADQIERIGMTPETFAARYRVPLEITITAVHGH
jgi:PPOX class probable F420-dependent enzyme